MSARALVLVAVAALCLTGCAKVVDGSPVPGAAVTHPMSAATVLGDYNTIDPCSMVDTDSLPADLQAQPSAVVSFDSCSLDVSAGGDDAEVDVGELIFDDDGDDTGTPESLPSGLWLYTGTFGQGSCPAYLKFAEDIEMVSTAYASDGSGSDALCAAAVEVARNVSEVLTRGPVKHRGFPVNSLAELNPCSILDPTMLAPTSLDNGQLTPYPAHHECDWSNNDGNLTESLNFIVGPPPTAQQDDGTAVQIAGRNSVTYSSTDDGAGNCWVDTGGMPFGAAAQNLVEIAEIYVSGQNQTAAQACSTGTALATAAWPQLPAAS